LNNLFCSIIFYYLLHAQFIFILLHCFVTPIGAYNMYDPAYGPYEVTVGGIEMSFPPLFSLTIHSNRLTLSKPPTHSLLNPLLSPSLFIHSPLFLSFPIFISPFSLKHQHTHPTCHSHSLLLSLHYHHIAVAPPHNRASTRKADSDNKENRTTTTPIIL
jgi:magnesium-transporting ATPase (P-type)